MIIFWIILFIIIVLISFVLSLLSMRDYQPPTTNPKVEYGLFLIRKTLAMDANFLQLLFENMEDNVISFERLFKGEESALLIYCSRKISQIFSSQLDLLEMEDYTTSKDKNLLYAWEFGVLDNAGAESDSAGVTEGIYENFPTLSNDEQFWLQVVLTNSNQNGQFRAKLRAIVYSHNSISRGRLTRLLQNLSPKNLIKLPKAYSDQQLLDFYKTRYLGQKDKQLSVNYRDVLKFIKV